MQDSLQAHGSGEAQKLQVLQSVPDGCCSKSEIEMVPKEHNFRRIRVNLKGNKFLDVICLCGDLTIACVLIMIPFVALGLLVWKIIKSYAIDSGSNSVFKNVTHLSSEQLNRNYTLTN
ncbi:Hypothetical protein NTJ_00784 [Nesidiocoris tenuis]|uniref:Uncharacterized protein n=1 Tax=Nesidiocoris tenuis TaxID=355587 RepID=A0ABN7A7M1_9HEMI|nr:Hypothetical protein NTJ_00784 [Nesidiocoris tenuis]